MKFSLSKIKSVNSDNVTQVKNKVTSFTHFQSVVYLLIPCQDPTLIFYIKTNVQPVNKKGREPPQKSDHRGTAKHPSELK